MSAERLILNDLTLISYLTKSYQENFDVIPTVFTGLLPTVYLREFQLVSDKSIGETKTEYWFISYWFISY